MEEDERRESSNFPPAANIIEPTTVTLSITAAERGTEHANLRNGARRVLLRSSVLLFFTTFRGTELAEEKPCSWNLAQQLEKLAGILNSSAAQRSGDPVLSCRLRSTHLH